MTKPLIKLPGADALLTPWGIGRACLAGAGEIMLQRNATTGAVFLCGIAWNSLAAAFGAVLGLIVATLTAVALRYDTGKTEAGLYGFNGALVGLAAFQFLAPGVSTVLLLALGAAASTLAMREMMYRFLLPALTAPFVLITWLLLAVGQLLGLAQRGSMAADLDLDLIAGVLHGIGQVMFQESAISGAAFLAGIALCSRRAAMRALAGSAIGCIVALAAQLPVAQISTGLFGYNSALAALALGPRAWWPPLLGAVLTVPLTVAMQKLGVIPLTAPFVLATWAIAAAWRTMSRLQSQQGAQ
jgi:urea transporter